MDEYEALVERWMAGENQSTQKKPTNLTWNGLGLGLGLHGEKLGANHQNYGMA